MSTTSRTTGISTTVQPQQQPAGQKYFKPKSEWKHEEEASFLLVYLPGFAMEQLTIKPDYSNGTVKLEGKRRLPDNRSLPVDETFNIPQDCDLSKMDKQLGRGILMLKMPKNYNVLPQQQTTKQTIMEETPKPQETVAADSITDPPKQTSTTDKAAIDEKISATKAAKSDEEKLVETTGRPSKPEESPESHVGNNNGGVKEEESKEQSKELSAMISTTAVAKVVEKKEKRKNRKSGDSKGKLEAEKKNNANGSAKKGMVKEVNEDRKLIVNMGLAILLIMGLGVSLFYTLG